MSVEVIGTCATVEVIEPQLMVEIAFPGPQGARGADGNLSLDCGGPSTTFLVGFNLDLGGVA